MGTARLGLDREAIYEAAWEIAIEANRAYDVAFYEHRGIYATYGINETADAERKFKTLSNVVGMLIGPESTLQYFQVPGPKDLVA